MRAVFLGMVLPLTAAAQLPPDLTLESFASGFSGITAIRGPHDGSGRVFVLEQGGTIRIVLADGTVLPTPFFRLCAQRRPRCFVPPGGFPVPGRTRALGPCFSSALRREPTPVHQLHRWRRPYRDREASGAGRQSRPRRSGELRDPPAHRTGFLQPQRRRSGLRTGWLSLHRHGRWRLGRRSLLARETLRPADLVTGGSCGSHLSRTLLGKMLRIDVDASTPAGLNTLCGAAPDGSAPYGIPPGNPFPHRIRKAAAPRSGPGASRNPWRFSFDRATGEYWIADVGQNTREEVNLRARTRRAGTMAGAAARAPMCSTRVPPSATIRQHRDFVPPLIEYNRTSPRCSVTGGYRYRVPPSICAGSISSAITARAGCWSLLRAERGPSSPGAHRVSATSALSARMRRGRLYVGTVQHRFRISGDLTVIFRDGFEG